MSPLAPEPVLRAALFVVHVAASTTRNWTLREEVPWKQVNDLWEALHEVPSLLTRWRPDAETELLMYFDEYDHKWPSPQLRQMYERQLEYGHPAQPRVAGPPMHYIRDWPEGLFILLVMALPLAAAALWRPETFLGFLVRLALGMLVGGVVWIVVMVVATAFYDRRKD